MDRFVSNILQSQLYRYLISSAIALFLDCALLASSTEILKLHYFYSSILGFCVGALCNYYLCVNWVFKNSKTASAIGFARFTMIGLLGLSINSISMTLLTEVFGFYYMATKLIATTWVFLFNFIARKCLVFN